VQNNIIGIIGPTGSGKTHLAAEIFAKQERAAVYQILAQDAGYLGGADDIIDGDMHKFALQIGAPQFRLIYRVKRAGSYVEKNRYVFPDFDYFVRACFERGNMMMLIDEAHMLCTNHSCPLFLWESIITGRHQALDITYITQRFAMVHRDITANTKEFYFWNIIEPSDLDGIQKRCGEEARDAVMMLRRTEDRRKDGGEIIPGEIFHWSGNGESNVYSTVPAGENANEPTTEALIPATGTGSGNVEKG
jgi:RecA/RadA recombinase